VQAEHPAGGRVRPDYAGILIEHQDSVFHTVQYPVVRLRAVQALRRLGGGHARFLLLPKDASCGLVLNMEILKTY
jgi:hypothetical protein